MTEQPTFSISLSGGPALVTVRREVDGVAIAASAAKPHRARLERTLDAFAEARPTWTDGSSIDTGWCSLTLRATAEGLQVVAPAFDGDPHAGTSPDLSVPLAVAEGWDDVRRAARVEPAPVRFDDRITAVVGWERCTRLTMTRDAAPEPGDSGWLIEPHESEPDRLRLDDRERLEAWMVQRLKPAAIRAAVLPPAYGAMLELDGIRIVVDLADGSVRSHGML
ncbi:hypothetical protein [Agrococcus terreus]|uniref:Glyoxalase-like domain-containing protein n=1 Tax=Agrococcus terreus TaxID=574649 RepID=A0ABQ2KCA9_9MICO|nr:hypothetical protein [Agrococcus terreus]GGN77329.1 hypothetical protein GCM10010968_01740 [Agrococcus terreus]